MVDWLDDIDGGRSTAHTELPRYRPQVEGGPKPEVRRALLLVGSPRRRKSTSNSLGEYMLEKLSERSVETATIYLHTAMRSPESTTELLDAVDAADLVTLAFPLYVDSLPAPVVGALERTAEDRKKRRVVPEGVHAAGVERRRQLFTAIANNGFPEAEHNAAALAMCEVFARQTGFDWAGSLALGGGETIQGQPLAQSGARTARARAPLEAAAAALAEGQAIPETARATMAKPVIPHWAYRFMGGRGWKRRAKAHGAQNRLNDRPYATRGARG